MAAVIAAGLLLGLLAKLGDVIPQGNLLWNLLSSFGRVSSSFTLWIFACLLISNLSDSRAYAAVHVALFLISMLIAYYAYSKLVVGYLSVRVVKFWLGMILPAALAGYMVHGIQRTRILKLLTAIAAAVLGIIGIVFIEGLEPYALLMEGILFLLTGCLLFKKDT